MNTYLCEVCGRTDDLTEDAAYDAGWDYPPFMGAWGVLSARTCPVCPIDQTAWWAITELHRAGEPVTRDSLGERHLATVQRILAETA